MTRTSRQIAKATPSFETFTESFNELFETLRTVKNAASANPNDLMLIRALSVLSEANNIIADQSNRINILESLVITDELTSILNRRGLSLEISKELNRVGRNLSLGGMFMVFDLDDFKEINDNHGHPAGDACLVAVANYLRRVTRATDILSRTGGDEFIVVLTNIDEQMGVRRIQQIMKGLDQLSFSWRDINLTICASYGFVRYDTNSHTLDGLIHDADQLLYAMKQQRKCQGTDFKALTEVSV